MKFARAGLGSLVVTLALSCSGSDLAGGKFAKGKTVDGGNAPAVEGQATVSGVKLAHIDITATHAVEFWEVQSGNVMMLQTLDESNHDVALDLGAQLSKAGGTFSALYRALMKDPHAVPPAELAAADEHRSHLPIRDGSLLQPAIVAPPFPSSTNEPVGSTQPPAQPGALKVQDADWSLSGFQYSNFASFCNGDYSRVDDYSCQSSTNGTLNGIAETTIYWESRGHNGSTSTATFTVNQQLGSAWQQIYHLYLGAGKTVQATLVGTAGIYQGAITGKAVAYEEHWQRSFPSLTQLPTHPGWATSDFANDIDGITHDNWKWIFSRSEGKAHGCLGTYSFPYDLQTNQPGSRCPQEEPGTWEGAGFNHYGDLTYDPVTPAVQSPGISGTGLLFVSLNKDMNLDGAVGAFNNDPNGLVGGPVGFAVINPGDQLAWIAVNPKNREFYSSSSSSTTAPRVIHRHFVDVPGNGPQRCPNTPDGPDHSVLVACDVGDLTLINDPAQFNPAGRTEAMYNIQGGKVSDHGKLWVNAFYSDTRMVVLGIDPYSGIVQTANFYAIPTDMFTDTFATGVEAEGLDITPNNISPNIGGQIHAQVLGNLVDYSDEWSLENFSVDDPTRL